MRVFRDLFLSAGQARPVYPRCMKHSEVAARLGVQLPIIQGPFGGGLSTVQLAATVSNAGGLGSYGAHILSPEAIVSTARSLRAQTSAPFALNLWISNQDPGGLDFDADTFQAALAPLVPYFEEYDLPLPTLPAEAAVGFRYELQVEALLEARPPVFSFVFGIPDAKILEACRARQIVTIGAATSIAEALALEAAGVDLIVATGSEAGGHRPSFLHRPEEVLMGTFSLVQLISARVHTPVIAAGGVVDGRGVRAAHALGAQAVQVGTAFLACEESGASSEHRRLLHSPRSERTTLTRSFSGRLARGLENRWSREWSERSPAPYPLQGYLAAQLRKGLAERQGPVTELGAVWGSQAAPNLRHHRAIDVMGSLCEGLD